MDGASRYEIVDTIARGDFAVVYRARDRELGREVAIKQIHQQFLADGRQLARYWQEAQLLASLQHPNILTIYDIVRPKGWLILELMHGSLQPATRSEGIDLNFLRIALADCLGALEFLHANGVIHGDIKPSNMLVDAQGRVKLGDFGLARRASNEEGSLLKGTTKYMAPESLSGQFGAVGPAGDLYSLGFSAYELMCGSKFETLFPGLSSFGRDRQIAWMMWHAAADRNLPPIGRVLEGVPPDLTRAIEHLVVKDQSKRCKSAKEALWELRVDPLRVAGGPNEADAEAEAAREAAGKKKRRMRFAAVAALAFSAVLSAIMLLPEKPKPASPGPPAPTRGVVTNVYTDEWRLAITQADDGAAKEISLNRYDRIFINDKSRLLRDLRPQDRIVISHVLDESGRRITEIRAFRPEIGRGRIKTIEADRRRITLAFDEGDGRMSELEVAVPDDLKITFNGRPQIDGRPVALADLLPEDRVVVHHVGRETGREATELSVERVVLIEGGVIRELDPAKGQMTISVGPNDNPRLLTIPFAPKCEITINDRRFINEKLLEPADLRPGDVIGVAHDTHAVRVSAYRVLGQEGVVRVVHYDAKMIDVVGQRGKPTTYFIGPKCKITLAGAEVELSDLRKGDVVEVAHDSPEASRPEAISVSARRPSDRSRWALLIANENFEDRSLSRPEHAAADAKLLRDALVGRYKVPADQTLTLADESLVRLEQSIPDFLGRLGADDKLLVYVAGRAYKTEDGKVYLAPRSFDLRRMNVTGLPLQWLIDRLEDCKAKEKLLLLDCGRAGDGADLDKEPSSAEMLGSLDAPAGRAALRTVTAIANSKAGGRGAIWPEKGHGLFAVLAAEGYSGAADKNRDLRLEPTELFDYLQEAIVSPAEKLAVAQSPELFLPDNRPPRLSEQAKTAIRRLAAYLGQDRIDIEAAESDYRSAARAAGKEIEPQLLFGLLLMKQKQRDAATKHFEEIHLQRPDLLLPLEAIAWMRFERRAYQSGVDELKELVSKVPPPKKSDETYPEAARQVFYWVGQLREYAAVAAEELRRPSAASLSALDAAVARAGAEAQRFYEQGRAKSREIHADFDKRIAAATSDADAAKLKIERRRIIHYVDFPYDRILRQILAGLDR
ncbi:MAG: serine/threonine protein kinase [Planctomycetes bacterium]|nr:serine/threonine protein kinase [Planctomycetota bacterium]MBU4398905.1 serine/threonine protein kinase [Planctomycetota bacterium]MCG2682195.1 serine/threonine protein kinase [Planctomycetales bacterium]